MDIIDRVRVPFKYDERRRVAIIEVPYDNFARMCQREYKEVDVTFVDSRKLSDKQRRCCYAMIKAIADYNGDDVSSVKEFTKLEFWTNELYATADTLFSLSDAPMSIVAAFQKWLARFIVAHDIPTKRPMLDYIDDTSDYVYACLIHKKCPICGMKADLHHVEAVGMGRDRDTIIHEGMKVLPLCRKHHTEIHTIGKSEFFKRYHIDDGIPADKTICKIYGLKGKKP